MNFSQAQSMIEAARRCLLVTHVRPDGDALGSAVALQQIMADLRSSAGTSPPPPDKLPRLLLLSKPAAQYSFLWRREPWIMGRDLTAQQVQDGRLDQFDLVIVLDTCSARQLPGLGDYLRRRRGVLVFDHHAVNDAIGTCRLIDPHAAAAGEIVFRLTRSAGWPLCQPAAAALYVALATDTGWFRFSNTSAAAYRMAADLVEAGARPDELYRRLFENFPLERVRLLARALQTIEVHCQGRLAVMHITRDMLRQTGASRAHIENMINECHQVGSVHAALLLVEQDDGGTRCSLRSKRDVDVNLIARQFGGGGHARAAGATLPLPLPAAREKLIAAFAAALPPATP